MSDARAGTLKLDGTNFEREVLASGKPAMVDFWAEWCAPCRALGPTIDALAGEVADRATVGKVDVDANQALAESYGIRSIPTLVFFKDGREVDRLVGQASATELRKRLADLAA
jgi:thioredoxin 1